MNLNRLVHQQMALSRVKAIDKANSQMGRGFSFQRPTKRVLNCPPNCQCAECSRPPREERISLQTIRSAMRGTLIPTKVIPSYPNHQLPLSIQRRNEMRGIQAGNRMFNDPLRKERPQYGASQPLHTPILSGVALPSIRRTNGAYRGAGAFVEGYGSPLRPPVHFQSKPFKGSKVRLSN